MLLLYCPSLTLSLGGIHVPKTRLLPHQALRILQFQPHPVHGKNKSGLCCVSMEQKAGGDSFIERKDDLPICGISNTVVGVLGGGQLGRMLCQAASQMAIKVMTLDPLENCPASSISYQHVVGSFDDGNAVREFAKRCGVLTIEIEHVDAVTLEKLEQEGIDCEPKASTIRIIQDKYLQKVHFSQHGIPVAEFQQIENEEEVQKAGEQFGYPLMIKSKRLAYDGRGNAVARSKVEIPAAVSALGGYGRGLYVEKWTPFVKELAVIVARGRGNTVSCYPVVETTHKDNICHIVEAPADISANVRNSAVGIAQKAVYSLEGAGVFAVELFLTADNQVLLNEVAPRPHNSGHHTIESCYTSQYEQHLRAVLGLPLGDPSMKVPAAIMYNLLGEDEGEPGFYLACQLMARALSLPGASVHWYDKPEMRKQRKMGHITIIGPLMSTVKGRLRMLLNAETAKDHPAVSPLVGIIMGSDSDLPVMKDAAEVLKSFDVPFEVTIVSAHRTPERMFSYASSAKRSGIQVIIAGAGGAAHLPGMVASLTPLPVIGVPIKTSSLSGTDSLLSIVQVKCPVIATFFRASLETFSGFFPSLKTGLYDDPTELLRNHFIQFSKLEQMPKGVPVATVAIGNAANAALLAVKILAVGNQDLWDRVLEYQETMKETVLKKAEKLESEGHQQYIGKVKSSVFHTQKPGRKRVAVSTEENVIASLDLRSGTILWRQALGSNDAVDNIDITLGRYVITLSKEGSVLRAWNLPDGQMVWESILHVSKPLKTSLLVPAQVRKETLNLVVVSAGSFLHAISGLDGEIIWSKDFTTESIEIHRTCQSPDGDVIHVLGFSGHSKVVAYQISARNGEVLKEKSATVPVRLSGESTSVSDDMLVALDATKSILVLVNSQGGEINVHQKYISELVEDFSGLATILPSKFAAILALKLNSISVLVQVKADGELTVLETIEQPGLVSDAIVLPGGQQALAVVRQKNSQLQLKIKVDDLQNDVLVESINVDQQRGLVQNMFINNYIRTDRSYGFRALLVMEDDSLLLVQQGEIVWNREDGLASIIDSTASELPVEKGGTVAKVEQNLLEWLKGHFLKLKGTLMLANPEEMAAIQGLRLRNSEKTKTTRDHNGFRKLLVVLTRSGKIYALHTGDGRIVWSCLPSSLRRSEICQHPNGLNIYPWQVPHHHALDENPSVMVIGRCEGSSKAPGFLTFIDSYTGNELSSLHVHHSIMQVMPLPSINLKEQRLHLVIDSDKHAHLYPRTPDSLDIFTSEIPNTYWYSIDAEKNMIRGHSLKGKCLHDIYDEHCFNSKQLWSIVFPPDSEKIIATAKRKNNEVVHTQAKTIGNEDVMYKYISNNVLFVATSAPKGTGDIGSVAPEEAKIVSYLIDTVTGRVLHRLTHHGAQGPVHAVFSENWVVYHYFNLRAHKYEMSVIEIYDQARADIKDVMKLALGKHNLTSPVSSYSWPEIVAKSQSFYFTHSVKAIAVTSTAKGITSKQLLIGTIGDQSYVTHSLQVEGLRGIMTIPAKLESTTLIFSYGIDLFFTQFAPSKTYDSLTEEFSYALLLITIVALIAAIFITWIMSQQKELKENWR